VKTLQYPVVVKPTAENAGKGVFTNIGDERELISVVDHVREELGYQDIIVEKHFDGTEYRVLVVDGEIVGAVNRRPANIQGDGESTIEELISQKNTSKRNNPIIANKTIEIDKEVMDNLTSKNLTLKSVLPKNKVVYLRNKSNVSRGGDPVDVTDQLTDTMKDIALKSTQAIEGLSISGLDMLVDENDKSCVVLEINTKPMIGLHMYPIQGQARDVVRPIVDFYFPNTKGIERSNLYFNFEAALSPIRNYLTNEVNLTPLESPQKLNAQHLLITGEDLNSEFRNVVRQRALQLGLNGCIEERKHNKKLRIVIATNDTEKSDKFILYLEGLTKQFGISNIQNSQWLHPINVGFITLTISSRVTTIQKLQRDLKRQTKIIDQKEELLERVVQEKESLKAEIKVKNKSIIRLDREKHQLKNDITELSSTLDDIYKSRSWNVTRPLRKFAAKRNKNI